MKLLQILKTKISNSINACLTFTTSVVNSINFSKKANPQEKGFHKTFVSQKASISISADQPDRMNNRQNFINRNSDDVSNIYNPNNNLGLFVPHTKSCGSSGSSNSNHDDTKNSCNSSSSSSSYDDSSSSSSSSSSSD